MYSHPLPSLSWHSSLQRPQRQRRGRSARLLHARPRGRAGSCPLAPWPRSGSQARIQIGSGSSPRMRLARIVRRQRAPDVGISLHRRGTTIMRWQLSEDSVVGVDPMEGLEDARTRPGTGGDLATHMKIRSGDWRWSNQRSRMRDEMGLKCMEWVIPAQIEVSKSLSS